MKFSDISKTDDIFAFFETNTPDINLRLYLKDTFTKQIEEISGFAASNPGEEILLRMRATTMSDGKGIDIPGYSFTLRVGSFMRGIFTAMSGTFIVNLALLDEKTEEIFQSIN